MLFITQLIYINKGQENVFNQFEDVALPILYKYGGRLLLRLRPDANVIIENNIETPYEVHLVEFESEEGFKSFMEDKERKQFLHLKEQSIRSVLLIKGTKI